MKGTVMERTMVSRCAAVAAAAAVCVSMGVAAVSARPALAATPKGAAATAVHTVQMQRLYNPNSGEHFYTANTFERDSLTKVGWKYEGVGWVAPSKSAVPVYRLYNKNAGDHHYTMNANEKNWLVRVGWKYEGIGWYSDGSKRVPLYRQYNPNAKAGSHNYTTNKGENNALVAAGWKAEGIAWYAVAPGHGVTNGTKAPAGNATSAGGSQQTAITGLGADGKAHGGAYCGPQGSRAPSDRGNGVLTCKVAKDGRLRWQR